MPRHATDDSVETAILTLATACGPDKSICPTDAARKLADMTGGDALAWREWLTHVRRVALEMAREGRLIVYRKGKPVDPDDFRGVYRLGLPRSD